MAPRQQVAADGPLKGKPQPQEKRCTHCGSSHTSGHWKYHPTSGQRLCNACRAYAGKHDGELPPNSVMMQRRRVQPRRMADVQKEMAQRRCLHCGSASPGSGMKACWNRHPATGEEWLCKCCHQRACRQLKKQQQQAETEAMEEVHRPGHSSEARVPEGQQAPTPQLRPISRKRRQERHDSEGAVPTAFRDGPATAAKRRADSHRLPAAGSGGSGAEREAAQRRTPAVGPVGSRGNAHPPAAKRRQRRKQAQPQHLPPAQPDLEPSLATTALAEVAAGHAGSKGPAADSLHGTPAAADTATQAAGQDLFDLLQASVQQAAAAASGLSSELAAAFVALPTMEARRVSHGKHAALDNLTASAASF